jgi:hypothetical protein
MTPKSKSVSKNENLLSLEPDLINQFSKEKINSTLSDRFTIVKNSPSAFSATTPEELNSLDQE